MSMKCNFLILLVMLCTHVHSQVYWGEPLFVYNLSQYIPLSESQIEYLHALSSPLKQKPEIIQTTQAVPLFKEFGLFQEKIGHISLGEFPTPVYKLHYLGQKLGLNNLYIKRDDTCGRILPDKSQRFSGNKVRKLEFLLADALAHKAKTVLTFGSFGSNNATATASCCQMVGLGTIAMLKPQPNSPTVRRNLLLMHHYGARLWVSPDEQTRNSITIEAFLHQKQKHGDFPYVLPYGNSCPIGEIGFINAVFELKEQIMQGDLPEPDYIYIAAGSYGSAAGLLLGIKAAHLKTKVVPVMIDPGDSPEKALREILRLFRQTHSLLHELDSSFGPFEITYNDILLNDAFAGPEYGYLTPEAANAIHLMESTEKINLDGTYTSKALAALIHEAQKGTLDDKVILYWHTFCGDLFTDIISSTDYTQLPQALHSYFETEM